MFRSIHRTRISDEVASQVKTLITEGKLKPGDRLPPERELIKQFGVSRPSLREALNSLVATGFLEVVQGNRTVVRSLVSAKIFEPLDNLLREDSNTVFELIEVRKAIETWNAYLAAKRASREDISHLEEIIESMKKSLEKGGPFPKKRMRISIWPSPLRPITRSRPTSCTPFTTCSRNRSRSIIINWTRENCLNNTWGLSRPSKRKIRNLRGQGSFNTLSMWNLV